MTRAGAASARGMLPSPAGSLPARPAQAGKEARGLDEGVNSAGAAASQLCVLANRVHFLCPSSLLCKRGEGPICLCGKSSQTCWLKTTDPSPLPTLEPEV